MEILQHYLGNNLGFFVWELICAVLLVVPLTIFVAYVTFAERKLLGYMHARLGANRVGPKGLLQPFADLFKFVFKELLVQYKASGKIFTAAPMIILICALLTWAVVPLSPTLVFTNVNASLLYVVAISSLGVYGIILGGYSSQSKYGLLGSIRASAQVISYEAAMGLAIISMIVSYGSIHLTDIVNAQMRLYKKLGIINAVAVIGGSMGGMQALCYAIEHPTFAKHYIPMATTAYTRPWAIALNKIAIEAIRHDPNFQNGNYEKDDLKARGLVGLAVGRMAGLIAYLSPNLFINKFGRDYVKK